MKNWSFYARIGILSALALLVMAANCSGPKPAPAVRPAAGQNGTSGQSVPHLPSEAPAGVPKEVGQGAAPDQAQVDSLKAAAAKERAKSQGKKPKN